MPGQAEAGLETGESLAKGRTADAGASSYSPLVVLGMAGLAAAIKLPEVAAGLLACFDGILRSGEFYQLRVSDVTFYSDRAALRMGLTKGGKRTGQEEMVITNSLVAVRWPRPACAGKRGSQLVLDKGSLFSRKWFKILLSEFRIPA